MLFPEFIPDQVITWVGGHAAKFGHGDDEAVSRTIAGMGMNLQKRTDDKMPEGVGGKPAGGDKNAAAKETPDRGAV